MYTKLKAWLWVNKTTIAGVVTAIAAGLQDYLGNEHITVFGILKVIGIAAFGYVAKDFNVTGGSVKNPASVSKPPKPDTIVSGLLIFFLGASMMSLGALEGCVKKTNAQGQVVSAPQPFEMTARDVIASAKGAIESLQKTYKTPCTQDSSLTVCRSINDAVAAQNLAINALHIYCASPDYDAGGACHPQPNAEHQLREALNQLDNSLTQAKQFANSAR